MAVAQDIVRAALKKAGVIGEGETPSAEQLTDALRDLNNYIAQANTERWMIFSLADLSFPADGRTTPYKVGPGGDYNISRRPDRIEAAYLRQFTSGSNNLPVDTPLNIWAAREQYSLATLKKNFVSYPSGVFLDPKWPLADLYVYPWPNAGMQYEVHLVFKDVLPVLAANTNTDATFPGHYIACLEFNLALILRQANGKLAEDPQLIKQAMRAVSLVKDSNLAIPEMRIPAAMGGGGYNIYSDSQG